MKIFLIQLTFANTHGLNSTSLINYFDIFAIGEHCPFKEQLEMLESSKNYAYKSVAVSADGNPHILSGNIAHRGVALLWKRTIDDFVTPLENIESDRIVGIRCDFYNCDPLFILSVYLPSSKAWSAYSRKDRKHVLATISQTTYYSSPCVECKNLS